MSTQDKNKLTTEIQTLTTQKAELEKQVEELSNVDQILTEIRQLTDKMSFPKKLSWGWAILHFDTLRKFVTDVIRILQGKDPIYA